MTQLHKTLLLALVLLSVVMTTMYVRVRAQVVTPPPDQLRYQAVLNEPIAVADQRGVVAGTSVLLIRDRQTGQCFLAVTIGNAMGLSEANCRQ